MAGGHSKSSGRKRARIEIIPLIDVIFFLLATFVLFTLSLNKSAGLPVQQPFSETGRDRKTDRSVTITILPEGSLAWNKEPIDTASFLTRITQYYFQDPDGRILINGDEKAKLSSVIYVMDEVRKAGFKKVYVETRVKPTGRVE